MALALFVLTHHYRRFQVVTFSLPASPTVQRIPRFLGEFPIRELSRILCRTKDQRQHPASQG
jgi:hypothetical protein